MRLVDLEIAAAAAVAARVMGAWAPVGGGLGAVSGLGGTKEASDLGLDTSSWSS